MVPKEYLQDNSKDTLNSFNPSKEEGVSNLPQVYPHNNLGKVEYPLLGYIQLNRLNNRTFNLDNLLELLMHPHHLLQVRFLCWNNLFFIRFLTELDLFF